MTEPLSPWEKRASAHGKSLTGVLFQGLSAPANAAIDRWHSWIVQTCFADRLPVSANILDLGCAYGRLTKIISAHRPDISIVGQDLSLEYCRLYKDTCMPSIQADAQRLPFRDHAFDGVLAVTCLMYTHRTSTPAVLEELRRITKPGGLILLIDPGIEMQRLIAIVRRSSQNSSTGGQGFGCKEYISLAEDSGFQVREKGGNPFLSSILMTPLLGKSENSLARQLMNHFADRDFSTSGYSIRALHRWLLLRRTP